MYKDYKLVIKADKIDFEYEVRKMMDSGWQPIGGVNIIQFPGYKTSTGSEIKEPITITQYTQAMVHESE